MNKIEIHTPALLALFEKHLSSHPNEVAYLLQTTQGQDLTLTKGELWDRSMAVAQALTSRNLPLTNALLIFDPGFAFIQALLGCFYSNTTAIPISIPKPRTKPLFQHFLHHSNPKYILTTSHLTERIKALLPNDGESLPDIIEVDQLPALKEPFPIQKIENTLAIIQYTSGSTAFPKGVMISFDNLWHNLKAIKNHFGLDDQSICFSWLPHYHDMGLIDGLLTPIFNQCKSIICSPYLVVSRPARWLEAIDQHRVTHTGGPNFILDFCVDRIPKQDAVQLDLSSLSHIYVSAEPVRKRTLERFAAHFDAAGFKSGLFTPGYGLAEATLMVTCKKRNEETKYHTEKTATLLHEYVFLGKPIEGIQLRIIDPHSGEMLGEGQIGEIVLSGKTIASGYYNDEESTASSMITLIENGKQVHYLKTGDLGKLLEGELVVVGRLKDTLILNGIQYLAEDIEYVSALSHGDIHQTGCAAFSIEADDREQAVIVVEIIKSRWLQCDPDLIRNTIREAVFDNFGITVNEIVLVPQGAVPKTTSGKIRRQDCRMLYLNERFRET